MDFMRNQRRTRLLHLGLVLHVFFPLFSELSKAQEIHNNAEVSPPLETPADSSPSDLDSLPGEAAIEPNPVGGEQENQGFTNHEDTPITSSPSHQPPPLPIQAEQDPPTPEQSLPQPPSEPPIPEQTSAEQPPHVESPAQDIAAVQHEGHTPPDESTIPIQETEPQEPSPESQHLEEQTSLEDPFPDSPDIQPEDAIQHQSTDQEPSVEQQPPLNELPDNPPIADGQAQRSESAPVEIIQVTESLVLQHLVGDDQKGEESPVAIQELETLPHAHPTEHLQPLRTDEALPIVDEQPQVEDSSPFVAPEEEIQPPKNEDVPIPTIQEDPVRNMEEAAATEANENLPGPEISITREEPEFSPVEAESRHDESETENKDDEIDPTQPRLPDEQATQESTPGEETSEFNPQTNVGVEDLMEEPIVKPSHEHNLPDEGTDNTFRTEQQTTDIPFNNEIQLNSDNSENIGIPEMENVFINVHKVLKVEPTEVESPVNQGDNEEDVDQNSNDDQLNVEDAGTIQQSRDEQHEHVDENVDKVHVHEEGAEDENEKDEGVEEEDDEEGEGDEEVEGCPGEEGLCGAESLSERSLLRHIRRTRRRAQRRWRLSKIIDTLLKETERRKRGILREAQQNKSVESNPSLVVKLYNYFFGSRL